MRLLSLLLAAIVAAGPALADEQVVVLRGSSAPPTPWYEPPPQPQIQTVYVPVYYYPVWLNGSIVSRHHHPHSAAHSPTRSR